MSGHLAAGFADPVIGAQACFRVVLAAMAQPGRIGRIGATFAATLPPPLQPASAAVLLTLVDADVPLHLDPEFAGAADWIRFHCGAPIVSAPEAAQFLLAGRLPCLAHLAPGTDEAPDQSASVILQVAALDAGRPYRLAGPGLAAPRTVTIDGLPDDFARRWAQNHALYPRGVDLILCAGDALAALPRSVAVADC